MYSEIFYENKKRHKKEMLLLVIIYLFLMFIVPYFIIRYDIIKIYATKSTWVVKKNIDLAFWIFTLLEFFCGIIVGFFTNKDIFYYFIIQFSFLIKFIIYILIGVIIWFFSPFQLGNFINFANILMTRIVVAYFYQHAIFFVPIIFCFPTIIGIQLGKLIKNKAIEERREIKNYASKN